MPFEHDNVTKEELLQFQFAINRMLQWAFANIRDNQIIDLSAAKISDLDVENLVSETTIVNNLYANSARIAELTVDELETSTKVQNYLDSDTSDVNYIRVYEQNILFIEATTDGLSTETVKNRDSENLYWTLDPSLPEDPDNPIGITTDTTSWPVTQYVYTEVQKMKINFQTIGGVYTPVIQLGAGTGVGDNGKAFIYKATDGLYFKYTTSTGDDQYIKNTDTGIEIDGQYVTDIDMYDDGMDVEFEDGTTHDIDFTVDGSGYITQIVNNTTGVTTNISWTAGSKP